MSNSNTNIEAYHGDTYIKQKQKARRLKHTWIIICIVAIIVSIGVDIANLSDVMAQAVHSDTNGIIVSVCIAFIYVALGGVSGHLYRLYINEKQNKQLYRLLSFGIDVLIIAFLFFVMIMRFNDQITNSGNSLITSIAITAIFTIAMGMGAIASWILGYFRKDAYTEEVLNNAIENIENDRELFESCKDNYINNNWDHKKINKEVEDINNSIFQHLYTCKYIKYQLLLIKDDPASAQSVINQS